jgi:N utilization substance protein B
MSARSKARKRALDILFASELRREDPVGALDRAIADGEGPTNDYTDFLVRGVVEHGDDFVIAIEKDPDAPDEVIVVR